MAFSKIVGFDVTLLKLSSSDHPLKLAGGDQPPLDVVIPDALFKATKL